MLDLVLDNPSQGGPAIARDGTLLVCDRAAVRARRELGAPQTFCVSKVNSDGCLPSVWGAGLPSASAGAGACSGAFALDFNAWVATGQDPALVTGQPVWGKSGFRDPQGSSGVGLINGLAFQLGP